LYEFVKQAWHVLEPGTAFVPGWHIEAICEHLEAVTAGEILRLLVNIPPRHSKSTIISVAWPCWEMITAPHQRYLCASYSSSLSIRDNLAARRLIQSPWYQERWGHLFQLAGDQNAKQRFETTKNGYRIATSVGGTATGEGGSRLILDDPHSAKDAQSDAIRESTVDWFNQVWSSRLNDPKRDAMVTVMQRLREMGGEPTLRMAGASKAGPCVTDNGNLVIDVDFGAGSGLSAAGLGGPEEVHRRLKLIPGVVETGHFPHLATRAYFGNEDGTVTVYVRAVDVSKD
jgi:hypothetical protein